MQNISPKFQIKPSAYFVGLIFILCVIWNCQSVQPSRHSDKIPLTGIKHKGAHVFGFPEITDYQFLKNNNIDWVTLIAWGSQKDYDSPKIKHKYGDSLNILKRDSSWLARLENFRAQGFKIFVKPHVWIDHPTEGKWRSDIFPTNDKNWNLWKENYREFILRYAKLADEGNAEMFCIGTEFSRLSVEKPEYWESLIQEVRSIYKGKLTYAANWHNEYEEISFWEDLDFIGIQAYFPLVNTLSPSIAQVSSGWKKHIPRIKSIHKEYGKQVLFTEMGYKSTTDGASKPWEWINDPFGEEKSYCAKTQSNCYQAFFDVVWEKEWFAGVHIWHFRKDINERNERKENIDFTPLDKPAEHVIKEGFQ